MSDADLKAAGEASGVPAAPEVPAVPVVAIEPAASGTGPAIAIVVPAATPGAPAVSDAPATAVTASAPTVLANGLMTRRFRGFLPVVIDVETGGFHSATDAL